LSLAACCLSFASIVTVVDDGNKYHHCHGCFIVVIEQTAKLSKMKNHIEILLATGSVLTGTSCLQPHRFWTIT